MIHVWLITNGYIYTVYLLPFHLYNIRFFTPLNFWIRHRRDWGGGGGG